MVTKYFENISPSKQGLSNLQKFERDLFQSTVKVTDKNEFTIEGLLTLDDMYKHNENDYKVQIKKEAIRKTPAIEKTTSFQNLIETEEEEFFCKK
jgi:hypothetical protein